MVTFANSLRQLGWSQSAFARFMGRNPRSVRRWCAGDFPEPLEATALLAVMRAYEISPADLEELLSGRPLGAEDAADDATPGMTPKTPHNRKERGEQHD